MLRRNLLFGVIILAVMLGGCATVIPPYDIPSDEAGPTVASIVSRITCELAETLYESEENYQIIIANDMDVALQLNLTVDDTGGLAPTFTYTKLPFSFNAGAVLSQSREQNFTAKYYYSMRELDEEFKGFKDRGANLAKKCAENVDTNLAGKLGLRETYDLAKTSSQHLQWNAKLSGTDGAFGGYVNFLVTKNLNMVGPTWTLTHFKGPGNLASVSEINTDKIAFAFAQGAAAGKPYNQRGPTQNIKADAMLQDITINQLATQLGGIRLILQ